MTAVGNITRILCLALLLPGGCSDNWQPVFAPPPSERCETSNGAGTKHEDERNVSPTTTGKPSFPTAKLTRPETREIWPVSYMPHSYGRPGRSQPQRLTVRPAGRCATVSIGEEYSQGTASTLRASVWLAATTAAMFVGRDVLDYCIQLDMNGHVDGPSMGGLAAAAMMAAMTRTPLRARATLTGTSAPDGVVGQVGALAAKLRGAADNGKRWFGYPPGQDTDVDPTTHRREDLRRVAAVHEVSLKVVPDLDAAYELLTGVPVPRRPELSEAAMALPTPTAKIIRAQILSHLAGGAKKLAAASKSRDLARLPGLDAAIANAQREPPSIRRQLEKGQLATALFASMRYLALGLALERMGQELSKQPQKAPPEALLRKLLAVDLIYVARMRCLNRAMMTGKGISNTTSQLGDVLLAMYDQGQAHHHLRKLGCAVPRSNKGANKAKKAKKAKKCGAELKAGGPKITSQQRDKIVAQALAKTVSFYQLSVQSELWRPVLDAGEDRYLVRQPNLQRSARVAAVEAEARLGYAEALNKKEKRREAAAPQLNQARLLMSHMEDFSKVKRASWPDLHLLASARVSALSSTRVLFTAFSSRDPRHLRQGALFAARMARSFAALTRKRGSVPLLARLQYQFAAERLRGGHYHDARLYFDAALRSCRLDLALAGGPPAKRR